MSLQELDRPLLRRCINQEKYAWEDFVDRFVGLVLHVIEHTSNIRAVPLDETEKTELCEAVFRSFRYNDFQLLREFSCRCTLTAYLTVITRRLVIAFLLCE